MPRYFTAKLTRSAWLTVFARCQFLSLHDRRGMTSTCSSTLLRGIFSLLLWQRGPRTRDIHETAHRSTPTRPQSCVTHVLVKYLVVTRFRVPEILVVKGLSGLLTCIVFILACPYLVQTIPNSHSLFIIVVNLKFEIHAGIASLFNDYWWDLDWTIIIHKKKFLIKLT